jgi:hypothetical protein
MQVEQRLSVLRSVPRKEVRRPSAFRGQISTFGRMPPEEIPMPRSARIRPRAGMFVMLT